MNSSSHNRNRLTRLVCLPLLLILGCGSYPEVSEPCFEVAKVMYTVCNLQKKEQISAARELASEHQRAGRITADEQQLLETIFQEAEEGNWQAAQQEIRELLLAQNRPAPTAAP